MNSITLTCRLTSKVNLGFAAESSQSIEVQRRNIDDWLVSQLLTKIMLAGNRRIMLELRSKYVIRYLLLIKSSAQLPAQCCDFITLIEEFPAGNVVGRVVSVSAPRVLCVPGNRNSHRESHRPSLPGNKTGPDSPGVTLLDFQLGSNSTLKFGFQDVWRLLRL